MGRRSGAEPFENAAKEAQGAAHVRLGECEAAKEQAQIAAISLAHGRRRVTRGEHDLVENAGKALKLGGGRGQGRRNLRDRGGAAGIVRRRETRGQLVQADGDGLAEIHGRLARVGGDGHEKVAEGEIGAGESALLRPEDQGHAAAAVQLMPDQRGESGKRDDGLLRLAARESAGAEDEGGLRNGFREALRAARVPEQLLGAHGRAGFAPVRLEGRDNGEMREAEVGQGARCGANVERIARGDEDDGNPVELGGGGQGTIVERETFYALLRYSSIRSVVQIAMPVPKKSWSSVQMGASRSRAVATTGQSFMSRAEMRAHAFSFNPS
jgi:hypothetical protein